MDKFHTQCLAENDWRNKTNDSTEQTKKNMKKSQHRPTEIWVHNISTKYKTKVNSVDFPH